MNLHKMFSKLPFLACVYLFNIQAWAGPAYECDTQGVVIRNGNQAVLSRQKELKVFYQPDRNESANVVVGDSDYLLWIQKTSAEPVLNLLHKTPEGLRLHSQWSLRDPQILRLPLVYLGQQKEVVCNISWN